MNNYQGFPGIKMTKILVALAGLLLLSPAIATSEVTAQLRVNEVVAEDWADQQDIANAIMNKVNAVPSVEPSYNPTRTPTATPSGMPSVSSAPTEVPSVSPSISFEPSATPSTSPSISAAPSDSPSGNPSASPTDIPSATPSVSSMPSGSPSSSPSISSQPSSMPSNEPSSIPSATPSEQPTSEPTKSPTSAPSGSPTASPTAAPTTSAAPSTTPTSAQMLKREINLIDDSSTRSTSLLIIGACAFVAVASTGVFLYRHGAHSSERSQFGYGAPITEVAADKDFEDGAGMISPMTRVSGLPRFSYDASEHKTIKQKNTDDDTDVELGAIPRSVYVSTPNTVDAVSDPSGSKENAIIKGVQKYFGQSKKIKVLKSSLRSGMMWNQIRDEGSPACSSGFAPASVPSMFSPLRVRGLPALLENDSDRTDAESLMVEKHLSKSAEINKSGSATESFNSEQLDIAKSNSKESYVKINRSGSAADSNASKYENLLKSASAYSNATRSVKSKRSSSPLGDVDVTNNKETAKSLRSNETKSVKSVASSKTGSNVSDNVTSSFEENMSEIKNILHSISNEQPSELVTNKSNGSKEDIPISHSHTPPELNPQMSSSSFANKAADAVQSGDFAFDADFDSATWQTEKESPKSHGAQLLSPITYEKELQRPTRRQEFSFQDLLSDPQNELYECHAPAGPLGIVIDSTPLGPRVISLNPMSSLFDSMNPGDIIVGIDDIDTVGMDAAEFWQLISRKAIQPKRIITMLKI